MDREPRNRIVGFKATESELRELDKLFKKMGFQTRSEGLRALLFCAYEMARLLQNRAA